MEDIDSIIEKIIKLKIPCLFVSPHLDDAVFSAGIALLRLSARTRLILSTVFTEASMPPYTLSAKVLLKKMGGFEGAAELFKVRRSEDKRACEALGADFQHLGLTDAAFRKKKNEFIFVKYLSGIIPEISHIYPVYRFHIVSGKIAPKDRVSLIETEIKLKKLAKIFKPGVVFCPAGIGGHVDHIIVRDVCRKIFANLILWEDFPYNLENKKRNKISLLKKLGFLNPCELGRQKIEIMSLYKSQIDNLIIKKALIASEVFYAPPGRDF